MASSHLNLFSALAPASNALIVCFRFQHVGMVQAATDLQSTVKMLSSSSYTVASLLAKIFRWTKSLSVRLHAPRALSAPAKLENGLAICTVQHSVLGDGHSQGLINDQMSLDSQVRDRDLHRLKHAQWHMMACGQTFTAKAMTAKAIYIQAWSVATGPSPRAPGAGGRKGPATTSGSWPRPSCT